MDTINFKHPYAYYKGHCLVLTSSAKAPTFPVYDKIKVKAYCAKSSKALPGYSYLCLVNNNNVDLSSISKNWCESKIKRKDIDKFLTKH